MKRFLISFILMVCYVSVFAYTDTLVVKKTADFSIDGNGTDANWKQAEWKTLKQLDAYGVDYTTKFKVMYSEHGMYVLFEGLDKKVTTSYKQDFEDLYNGDVFEVFFHPDTSIPLYFEYEVNAYNKELVLLIPHLEKGVGGWVPWNYRGDKKVQKKTIVHKRNGVMEKWTAEIFVPFKLLSPLGNNPPVKGTHWNANFYRLDYDSGNMVKFAWMPVDKSFHEFKKYGTLRFE